MLEWSFHGNLCRTIGPLTLHSQEILYSHKYYSSLNMPSRKGHCHWWTFVDIHDVKTQHFKEIGMVALKITKAWTFMANIVDIYRMCHFNIVNVREHSRTANNHFPWAWWIFAKKSRKGGGLKSGNKKTQFESVVFIPELDWNYFRSGYKMWINSVWPQGLIL